MAAANEKQWALTLGAMPQGATVQDSEERLDNDNDGQDSTEEVAVFDHVIVATGHFGRTAVLPDAVRARMDPPSLQNDSYYECDY